MRVLALDTTGTAMSVAVMQDGRLLGEIYTDIGKKHSVTLMAAMDSLLHLTGYGVSDMDAFAVAAGPGSFTGIRIGVAAAAALAYAESRPVYAVNTLDALLMNMEMAPVRCAIMDARRGEVYTKAEKDGDVIVDECAMPLMELLDALQPYGNVTFAGDAALRFRDEILQKKPDSLFCGEQFALQHASCVCKCVYAGKAEETTHDKLRPHYLRKSQAERLKCERESARE